MGMNDKKLTALDQLFGFDNAGAVELMLPINQLVSFKGHPYHVSDDEEMEQLTDSVREHGVLNPIIVREIKEEGGYEIVSGHRRRRAAELAGLKEIPAIIREMTDEDATILMVDSNLYREHLLPSEKAFAYRMKNEAMKRQGKRNDLLDEAQRGTTAEQLGSEFADSARQVFRFIRLTYLISELLELTDDQTLNFSASVSLSYLKKTEQQAVYKCYQETACIPTSRQAQALKALSREKEIEYEEIKNIIANENKQSETKKVILKHKVLEKFFPENTSSEEIENIILQLLKNWSDRK